MLIDRSYFVGEINVPNWDQEPIGELLDTFIAKYEDQFLRQALGLELYNAFNAGLLVNPVSQRFNDLLYGTVYTWGGLQYAWFGLVQQSTGTVKQSPIANYIYYFFMRDGFTQSTTLGESKTSKENATSENPGAKMARAWNEMSRQLATLQNYMWQNLTTYPEWKTQRTGIYNNRFGTINEFGI